MAYQRHGRYSSNDPGFATLAAGTSLAAVLDAFPTNGWVTDIIIHAGKYAPTGGTPTLRASVYDTASGGPDDKVADTTRFTPAALMDTGSGGDIYVRPINWTGGGTGSPLSTAMKARSGVKFAIDVNAQGSGSLAVGMVFAVNATNENRNIYRQFGVGSTPPSSFSVDEASYEGQLSYALGYYPNTKPVAIYTGATGTVTVSNPTIAGSFADAEEVYGDRMTLYQISVRNKVTGASMWAPDEFVADGDEKDDGAFAIPYVGIALVPGATYQVMIRVADEFGTWSNWTAWTSGEFTYSTGPSVTATGPTGKQNTFTALTFAGGYKHQNTLAGNAVKVRIKRNGSLYYESGTIAKTIAAPGSSSATVAFTITQASLSPALASLPVGSSYTLEIAARDSANAWSGYSPPIAFTTDSRPNVPTGLSPATNSVVTTRPLVTFLVTDPDDTPPTLQAFLRIKNSAGTVLFTRTAIWNSTKNRFEYQITSTDFATFATYRIDAYANDGVLASSTYSAEAIIYYADGPQVSFVRPLEAATVLTTRTRMTWEIDSGDQAEYNLEIRTASEGFGTVEPETGWDDFLWSTGWTASTTLFDYQIPAEVLDNETWYRAIIHVRNALGIEGTASSNFYVEFPPLRVLNGFSASVVAGRFDKPAQGSQVLLTWEITDYAPSQFEEYRVTKRLSSESPGKARTIFRTSSPTDNRFIDDNVRGAHEYVYAVRQTVTRDGDTTHSERVEAAAIVAFRGIIINDATYSGDFRVVIRTYTEFTVDNSIAGVERVPWGAEKPVVIFGAENYDIPNIVAQFIDDEQGTALDYVDALNELRDRRVPVFVRHPRGHAWFCSIKRVGWDFTQSGMPVATIELVQNNYSEGEIL